MAVAAIAVASASCHVQPISERLYDVVFDCGPGKPAMARMITDKLLERSSIEVEELLGDGQLLPDAVADAVDDAYNDILDEPAFRLLRSQSFADMMSERVAVEDLAEKLLGERMSTAAADDAVDSSPSAEHNTSAPGRRRKKGRRQQHAGADKSL